MIAQAVAAVAGAYQALAAIASLWRLARRDPVARELPPVSILKPVYGLDPHFAECIRSHAAQDYPEYEILFGVRDPADPAVAVIEKLGCEKVRVIQSGTAARNGKVGVLADLAAAAQYPILVVNDSDIRVPRDYLKRIVAPLEDPRIGMVTCLYRARADSWPGRLEALGIATDFAPSVLVAPLVGVSEFALGSTMAFRAADLARAGGFAAIADYIADDYQLSRRIRGLGLKVHIARCVVETSLGAPSWTAVWRHQVRWARTIRVSRGGGYLGLPVTNATLWAIVLGNWPLLGVRLLAGVLAGAAVLRDRNALRYAWLIPLRDLGGLAVWLAGLFGSEVHWRDVTLRLDRQGRIVGGTDSR